MPTFHLSYPSPENGNESIGGRLASLVTQGQYASADIAIAYATVAGVRAFLDMFGDEEPAGRMVLGLDDAITQPGALELLRSRADIEVRVASRGAVGKRFHPKFIRLRDGIQPDVLVVGSANLTQAALRGNSEACLRVDLSSLADRDAATSAFDSFWALGQPLTDARLKAYTATYLRVAALRKALERATGQKSPSLRDILAKDDALLDPSLATQTWIECGSVTALGRELELKAEQARFFGIGPQDKNPRLI